MDVTTAAAFMQIGLSETKGKRAMSDMENQGWVCVLCQSRRCQAPVAFSVYPLRGERQSQNFQRRDTQYSKYGRLLSRFRIRCQSIRRQLPVERPRRFFSMEDAILTQFCPPATEIRAKTWARRSLHVLHGESSKCLAPPTN